MRQEAAGIGIGPGVDVDAEGGDRLGLGQLDGGDFLAVIPLVARIGGDHDGRGEIGRLGGDGASGAGGGGGGGGGAGTDGGGGASASFSGALLAQPAITAHSAAVAISLVPRITFSPRTSGEAKNRFGAVNSD